MQKTKIIIVGQECIDKLKLAKLIETYNDDIEIAYTFTSDPQYKNQSGINENYIYFMNNEEINLCFKNNAILSVHNVNGKDYVSRGITLDSFYNADIFCMNIEDFNSISDTIFAHNDILVIWLDTKNTANMSYDILSKDINETKYLIDRLNKVKYLYFLDEKYEDVCNIILKYINSTDTIKEQILEENS